MFFWLIVFSFAWNNIQSALSIATQFVFVKALSLAVQYIAVHAYNNQPTSNLAEVHAEIWTFSLLCDIIDVLL